MTSRSAALAIGLTGVALVAAGCSGSGSTSGGSADSSKSAMPSPTPSAATPTPTPSETETSTGGASALPPAPAGATELGKASKGGYEYARYKISMTPKKVVNKYKKQATGDGYKIQSSGGSGGGWGGYGGSEYGMKAQKGASYLDVQAGAEKGAPTYYEVCVAQNGSKSGLRHCGNESEQDSREDSRSSGS